MRNAELYLKGATAILRLAAACSTGEHIRTSSQLITRRVSDNTKLLRFLSLR